MTAIRCPVPRLSCQTADRSPRPVGWLRPGPESTVIVAQTSRCTVGQGGTGKAGLGNHLSSMSGGETARAVGIPNAVASVSADTASSRQVAHGLVM